ncbi:MAG: stage V sporulation protein AD [Oscillospiraceae bacterium]
MPSQKLSQNTFKLTSSPSIKAFASIVGKKEGEGPLASYFDTIHEDTTLGEETWEKSESKLQTDSVNTALSKASLSPSEVDLLFAGDLLNQCIGSSFGLRELNIPFYGLYGACSTMAESLGLASIFADNNLVTNAVAVTSSHFCSAERQFRFPLEYGGQRTPTAQWTVTGSGAVVVSQSGNPPYIKGVTVGKIQDLGIKDINNMGGAMAPAAAYTIKQYLTDTCTKPSDYDLIVTGDLGIVGSDLLIQLLKMDKIDISKVHNDCGKMIFDADTQDVHAGGSGCGCSASVLCSYILKQVQSSVLKEVLFISTGALMSPTSIQQGESIPAIAHLVHISNSKW